MYRLNINSGEKDCKSAKQDDEHQKPFNKR